jgi:putative membrane-bound dehydrogenase-like protein
MGLRLAAVSAATWQFAVRLAAAWLAAPRLAAARLAPVWLAVCCGVLPEARAQAAVPATAVPVDYTQYETPALAAPAWVRQVDQGEHDRRLAGLYAPEGVRVEIVAEEPAVVNPVGIRFDESGTLYVLEWRVAPEAKHVSYEVSFQDGTVGRVNRMQKSVPDQLKRLIDADGDGLYERAEVVLDDLEIPSSLLWHEGWLYLTSIGHVVRRRPVEGTTAWAEEELLRGLCGFHHHQASGLTLSHDGWLYVTSGDDDNRGEGSDGSRAIVLRTGAVFRCRPDGSQLHEFARGFRNPYRDVAFDHVFNMFHVDNDQEDGSKFTGCRLMHIVEGGDYGWRLYQGAVCCRTDTERAAVFGELPGKLPSLAKTGRGSPAGLLIYQGTAFPEFFRGLLIYPDVYRKLVRAYAVDRWGATFRVVSQFDLLRSEEGLFRPCHAIMGPDGAIYIADWRTDSGGAGRLWGDGEHGRIYRLTWSGFEGVPAIAPGRLDTWQLASRTEEGLIALLDTPDFELRLHAQRELLRRGPQVRKRFADIARDAARSVPARAVALGGLCWQFDRLAIDTCVVLLDDADADLRRLAATALSHNTPRQRVAQVLLAGGMRRLWKLAAEDPDAAVRRAAALAAGTLAAHLPAGHSVQAQTAKQLARLVLADDGSDVYLRDGILRGLERLGDVGLSLLVTPAIEGRDIQRQRALEALESLRTAAGARALNAVMGAADRLAEAELVRVLAAYRHILVEPPVDVHAVADWLLRHTDASPELQIAALETLALCGSHAPQSTLPVVLKLLEHPQPAVRQPTIELVGRHHLTAAAPALAALLRQADRALDERLLALRALGQLRQQEFAFGVRSEAGLEQVLDELLELSQQEEGRPLRAELMRVAATVDFQRVLPLAEQILASGSYEERRAAIGVLGADPQQAQRVAKQFIEGRLDRSLLPDVAAALQRHIGQDVDGQIAALLREVLRGSLAVSLDPQEVARVEEMVRLSGDPLRGRGLYLDARKGQCAQCHTLEGVGGKVGPDLSKVWETHTVSKLMESLIDPSKEIKEGFQTFTAITTSGQVYTGLRIAADERQVTLRDAEGRDLLLAADEIEELAASPKSLMPEAVTAQLSLQELVDLVAFLKNRPAQESLRGLPTTVWVAGPYEGRLDAVDAPERHADPYRAVEQGKPVSWTRLGLRYDGLFDLARALPGEDRAAYVLAYVYSPGEQPVELKLWFDDELKLLLNGEVVHQSTAAHQEERVAVKLGAGWNTLLARVVNRKGEFLLRLSADRSSEAGLQFASEPPR